MNRLWRWVLGLVASIVVRFRARRSPPPLPAPEPPPADQLIRAVMVDEQPDALSPGECYLIGESEFRWFAVLICPCGCGDAVVLNLLTEMRPCWRVEVHPNDVVTFHPSINRTVGCRSHFFVRQGRVAWCAPQSIRPQRRLVEPK